MWGASYLYTILVKIYWNVIIVWNQTAHRKQQNRSVFLRHSVHAHSEDTLNMHEQILLSLIVSIQNCSILTNPVYPHHTPQTQPVFPDLYGQCRIHLSWQLSIRFSPLMTHCWQLARPCKPRTISHRLSKAGMNACWSHTMFMDDQCGNAISPWHLLSIIAYFCKFHISIKGHIGGVDTPGPSQPCFIHHRPSKAWDKWAANEMLLLHSVGLMHIYWSRW